LIKSWIVQVAEETCPEKLHPLKTVSLPK
jgi:hypothetical protein